ncbi:LIM domain-containing protein isoform X2 [Corythoichthys intestinalis]|nr:LIM domain-containing protein isoform X2 [Corythoichthys intestinalis]
MKMAENSQLKNEDHHRLRPEDNLETQSQQLSQLPTAKESLHHQRQKCELRRLLKHTHPELKMLDEVVDEELAEVLSSESEVTADETGYEGEVRSRCLIFESCSQRDEVSAFTPRMHMTEELIDKGSVGKTSAVFEDPGEKLYLDQTAATCPDSNRECEEDVKRINVHETRRIFESQSVDTSQPNSEKVEVSTPSILTGLVQEQGRGKNDQNLQRKVKANDVNLKAQPKEGSCNAGHSTEMENEKLPGLEVEEQHAESIKTRAYLMQNNPFIAENIEHSNIYMEKPKIIPEGDFTTKVKNRTHLFESMPFDKIKQQNRDQVETMVETLKESLTSLDRFNVIRADGAIIEVNETMRAKKAKYKLSESGATINYDDVSEGNFQNFILQLLPRANLKPQVTYLMEACNGSIKSTLVNVPVHQHQFTGTQDMECNTVNVVQLVEDILNQDNSLRKGVIIQEADEKSADIVIYSLYKYSDEQDVRRYCPQEYFAETDERKSPLIFPDSPCQESVNCEVTMKGNVKLFRSCIEKGDLEYLKTLQAKSTCEEQEVSLKQTTGQCRDIDPEQRGDFADEGTPEWVPVDIKKLRNMFSENQRQTQSNNIANKDFPVSTTISKSQNVTFENIHSSPVNEDVSTERNEDKLIQCGSQSQASINPLRLEQFETMCGDEVIQPDFIKVTDENEISNLQTAINSLQKATMEAQSLHQLSQEKQKSKSVASTETPDISAPDNYSQLKQKELNTSPQNSKTPEEQGWSTNSAPHTQNEIKYHNQIVPKEIHTATSPINIYSKDDVQVQYFQATVVSPDGPETQQKEEETVFQGNLKSALDSLGRSNMNVTRGDFRAAMLYRQASKPPNERAKTTAELPSSKVINQEICATAFPTQPSPSNVTDEKTSANVNPISTVTQKNRKPIGPKPAIPPKPEHLKVKQQNNHSTNAEKHTNDTNTDKLTTDISKIKIDKEAEHDLESQRKLSNELQKPHENGKTEQSQGPQTTLETSDRDKQKLDLQDRTLENVSQDILVIKKTTEGADCNETCKTLGGTNDLSKMRPPIKPKRVKISQPDNKMSDISTQVDEEPQSPLLSSSCSSPRKQKDDNNEQEIKQEGKVELRAKRGKLETEDERRQRLSVHMDEIIRGNIGAAMEIFDNLRKQEELRGILGRVEEIEQDTSNVDVRSLRKVFEDVPDWVVSPNKKKPKQAKNKETKTPSSAKGNKSSMAHIFGDLERASEEIMTLKEQTLARLVDIEEAIKKALCSVSNLKSESDIASLSCLFEESLGSAQGNISKKISIGSSKTESLQVKEGTTAPPCGQNASVAITPKPREGLPCSPAFISIQSVAKKSDKPQPLPLEATICPSCQHSPEKFYSTKMVQCNSPAVNRKEPTGYFPQREISVLEVQTDMDGSRILGAKTVKGNYERLDAHGNRIYSSTTSTFVTTQPETRMTSTDVIVTSPALHQVTTYPEILLPVNPNP